VFGFEVQVPRILNICKERSNEEDKYMEFRPEKLAFSWPLITLFARCPDSMRSGLLANSVIVNPKSSPANVIVIYERLLTKKN
jgi:hypothetical protein